METIVKNLSEVQSFLHKIGHQSTSESNKEVREHHIPVNMLTTFDQFTHLTQGIDNKSVAQFSRTEISDIADQGLQLLSQIYQWVSAKDYQPEKLVIQQASLLIVKWLIEHKGQLNTLDLVVDTLASLANKLNDEEALMKLSDFMGQILLLCSDAIKQDFDTMNPHRPWRILNLNRGIIATRTHDPKLMREVFKDLLMYLPLDAKEFFQQGLSEMIRLDYPDHVQAVVQEFYDLSCQPHTH